jgi:hypothetical protein
MSSNIRLGGYPVGNDRVNDMHGVVEPTSTIAFRGVAFVAETYMSLVAIFATTVSLATAWIAVNHVFEDELDALWDGAMIQGTAGTFPFFCAVSL